MNKIQKLINGKPSEFARRIGCPKSTANHYSNGTRTPPEWVYRLIEDKLDRILFAYCVKTGKTITMTELSDVNFDNKNEDKDETPNDKH